MRVAACYHMHEFAVKEELVVMLEVTHVEP